MSPSTTESLRFIWRWRLRDFAKQGNLLWIAPLPKTAAEKAKQGDKLAFAPDGVHPYPETGHELYLQAIVRSLKPIAEASKVVGPHAIGTPLVIGNYEDARMVPIREARLSAGFVPLDLKTDDPFKYFATRLGTLYRGTHPGDTVTFKFSGTCAAIYDVIGPDSGQVVVTVDDQPPQSDLAIRHVLRLLSARRPADRQ